MQGMVCSKPGDAQELGFEDDSGGRPSTTGGAAQLRFCLHADTPPILPKLRRWRESGNSWKWPGSRRRFIVLRCSVAFRTWRRFSIVQRRLTQFQFPRTLAAGPVYFTAPAAAATADAGFG